MTITGILTAIVIGLIIGALGRLVLPGRQRIPIWLTILVAALGVVLVSGLYGRRRSRLRL